MYRMKLIKFILLRVGIFGMSGLMTYFILSLLMILKSHAALKILLENRPILKDQNIEVVTFYNDETFDGFYTKVYRKHPFYEQYQVTHSMTMDYKIQHQAAVCWITDRILVRMMADMRLMRQEQESAYASQEEVYVIYDPASNGTVSAEDLSDIEEETELEVESKGAHYGTIRY